ncbi:hypothetical protein [Mucilaginibacter sp.]
MKTTATKTTTLLKSIDQQLKTILEKDIRNIKDPNIKNAVFLQLIAA